MYYSLSEAHTKRVRTVQKLVHNTSLSAEINLQDIDFQSCRFFFAPKNAPKMHRTSPLRTPTGVFNSHIPHTFYPRTHYIIEKKRSSEKICIGKIIIILLVTGPLEGHQYATIRKYEKMVAPTNKKRYNPSLMSYIF